MDYSQAIDTLEREAVKLQAVNQLLADLKAVGSLEGAAKAAESRLAETSAALALLEPKLKEAQAGIEAANDEASRIRAGAEFKANELLVEAQGKASDKLSDATAAGNNIIEAARQHASSLEQGAADKVAAANDSVRAAKAELESLRQASVTAKAELESIESKLAQVKAKAAELLG